MALGTISDLKNYNDYINGSFFEQFVQNSDVFNAASRGALLLNTEETRGDYKYTSFFEEGPDVERRDDTASSGLTPNAVQQNEIITVKLNRRKHQAANRGAFLKIGMDPAQFGRIYGAQLENAVRREMVNRSLAAANAAISNVSGLLYDGSGSTMSTSNLAYGLQKFGDNADKIVCWVMHSKVYYDLVVSQITGSLFDVTGMVVREGSPVTLGRPVIVTDSASLVVSATADRYITLGLTAGAVDCSITEDMYTAFEEKTGNDNIQVWWQTEYAYNLGLKGFAWDVGNGGRNPSNANVATAGNWDQQATSNYSLPGVRIRTQ